MTEIWNKILGKYGLSRKIALRCPECNRRVRLFYDAHVVGYFKPVYMCKKHGVVDLGNIADLLKDCEHVEESEVQHYIDKIKGEHYQYITTVERVTKELRDLL